MLVNEAHISTPTCLEAAINVAIYDLVVSNGIKSSSILYNTSYAMYDHTICNAHVAIYKLYATKSLSVYWALMQHERVFILCLPVCVCVSVCFTSG